jgi:hypothetical protein
MKKIAIREYFIYFALVYVPRCRDKDGHIWKLRRLAATASFIHCTSCEPASTRIHGSLELKDIINHLGEHLGHHVIAFTLGNIVMIILEPIGREVF